MEYALPAKVFMVIGFLLLVGTFFGFFAGKGGPLSECVPGFLIGSVLLIGGLLLRCAADALDRLRVLTGSKGDGKRSKPDKKGAAA